MVEGLMVFWEGEGSRDKFLSLVWRRTPGFEEKVNVKLNLRIVIT
jgi:hypothetical protein